MSESPAAVEASGGPDMEDAEPRSPMRRLGSSRKLAAFNEIRQQLSEQQRCVEARAEAQVHALHELQELCRRRGELEADYGRALDRLANRARHRADAARGPLAHCWRLLADNTDAAGGMHAALAKLCSAALAPRLARAADDAVRVRRRARGALAHRHGQLAAALTAAADTNKSRVALAAEWRAQAAKLRAATAARDRLAAAATPHAKKLRHQDKEMQKRSGRHAAARLRALRARCDHVLSVRAATAALAHYYSDDLADYMDCMDVGIQRVVTRAMNTLADSERRRAARVASAADALQACVEAMDPHSDRLRYLETHTQPLCLPRRLHYAGPEPEAEDEELAALAGVETAECVELRDELTQRLCTLERLAEQLRAECADNCKTLDAAEERLLDKMEGAAADWAADCDLDNADERKQHEDYFIEKFRDYMLGAGRLVRVESKLPALREMLGLEPTREQGGGRRRRGAPAGGEVQVTPLVAHACHLLARAGAHTTGVFRVSGAQQEVSALLAAYERGERPLQAQRNAGRRDVHAVASLLKLHLRRRRPPLLGAEVRAALSGGVSVAALSAALRALPVSQLVCVRHVCGLLAHLARESHVGATHMDAWNLAVCVGPSLLPAAAGDLAEQNMYNNIVKMMIDHYEQIFPSDIAPHTLFIPPSEAELCADEEPTHEEERSDPNDDVWIIRDDAQQNAEMIADDDEDILQEVYDEQSDVDEEDEEEQEASHAEEGQEEAHRKALTKSTPDLVLDLPARPTNDKEEHGVATGSPRLGANTAKMAAKFADLTLTGGSRR